MSPEQFLLNIAKQRPAPAYLFLGQEGYQRRICKDALIDKVLPGEFRQDGLTQIGLDEIPLTQAIDDACSLSLFAANRVIWLTAAESALPRRLSTSADDDDTDQPAKVGADAALKSYLKAPTPGTIIVFECSRFDFTGDDKPKLERVSKFYAAVPDVVEFRCLSPEHIRALAQELLRFHNLKVESRDLAMLVDSVGADASRLANEIEKLSLFAGEDRKLTSEDLRALVANASQSNIFALVSALGRRDRAAALMSLDTLVRDGEYLPLALTFLGTQFRLAAAAQEARLNNAQQIVNYFSQLGVRMWRDRAEQLLQTASAFTSAQIRTGLRLLYEADKALRDSRPDDRTVMEAFVLNLTR